MSSFTLPIKVLCDGAWQIAFGASLCSTPVEAIKVKIPPTQGIIRVMDCNRDLTKDGNPDEFNQQTWKEGWWIFSREKRVLTDTPMIPLRNADPSCPIVVSLAESSSAAHSAVIAWHDATQPGLFGSLFCGGEPVEIVNGTAVCKARPGTKLRVNIAGNDAGKGKSIYNFAGCGVKAKRRVPDELAVVELSTPAKPCQMLVTGHWLQDSTMVEHAARILYVPSLPEGARGIDSPTCQ